MSATASPANRSAAADVLTPCRRNLVEAVVGELMNRENIVVQNPESKLQFIAHVQAALDDVFMDLRGERRPPAATGNSLSRSVGWARASQGVPPNESFRASLIFFEMASACFLAALDEHDLVAGVAPILMPILQRNLIERTMTATVRYMDYLIGDIQATHIEERSRISREIHDRVSNGVSLAYRSLELCQLYESIQSVGTAARVHTTRSAFVETMSAINEINSELRTPLSKESLRTMVGDYFETVGAILPKLTVTFSGDESRIPAELCGELFMIMREAIRNALRHAKAALLEIEVEITGDRIRCSVSDDGAGFEPAVARGVGLLSMHERAAELGGRLEVTSREQHGTRVDVLVSLGPGGR